jgi:7,8-dihydro-6-hydroxymethylpterin dimethyltransferase
MTDARYRSTTSLCATCLVTVPAEVWRRGDRVVMSKHCAVHGPEEVVISSSADWYDEVMMLGAALEPPPGERKPVSQGCPYDCGPCESHEQRTHMPVVPITSSCNLDCPICYTHNKNEGAYHMSETELRAVLGHLRRAAPERRIINLTGGEPTLHPQFQRLVELCHEEGIRRITISTHGLRFLKDEWLLEGLARVDARVVLSFDSLEAEANRRMLGGSFLEGKLRVLDLLGKHGVATTLLPVIARGLNDHELGALADLALAREHVRSLELHPMTFTGQSGTSFDRAARYTTHDLLSDLETQTGGRLRVSDFVPSPVAHPLCYLVTYLLRLPDGRWLPFPRFMDRADLRSLLTGALYLEPSLSMERTLEDVITRLWAGEIACDEPELVLSVLKRLVSDIFAADLGPAERMRVAERETKAIYVHTHMDQESFDSDRIRQCCVGMPAADGTSIPSCAYNVLYRERDHRFTPRPAAPLVQLGRGRRAATGEVEA